MWHKNIHALLHNHIIGVWTFGPHPVDICVNSTAEHMT